MEVESIECVAGRGIRHDRFFDYRDDYKGQITFFSLEVFDNLCAALHLENADPASTRRNVVTRGVDLKGLIGQEFEVQGVHFRGTGDCRPCYWMDQALGSGAEQFLGDNGGLRARILTSGIVVSTARLLQKVV